MARYREELRWHADRHQAMAVALRRAGPAILASAATVIAGMLCLLVAQSANISGLGPVAAIGIAVGLLAMITLLPALLVTCGRWGILAGPGHGSADPAAAGLWMRAGRSLARRPRLVWAGTAVVLACAALGLTGFKVGTLTTAQSFQGTPPSVTAEQVLARHFPGGSGEPFTLPLVILTEIGCTVAIGVLLDTIIVRSVLVTALTADIGRRMWWPSRLAQHRPPKAPAEPSAITSAR